MTKHLCPRRRFFAQPTERLSPYYTFVIFLALWYIHPSGASRKWRKFKFFRSLEAQLPKKKKKNKKKLNILVTIRRDIRGAFSVHVFNSELQQYSFMPEKSTARSKVAAAEVSTPSIHWLPDYMKIYISETDSIKLTRDTSYDLQNGMYKRIMHTRCTILVWISLLTKLQNLAAHVFSLYFSPLRG